MQLPAIAIPLILKAIGAFIPVGRKASESEKAEAKQILAKNNGTVTSALAGVVAVAGITTYSTMDEAIVSIGMAVLSLVLFLVNQNGD